MEVNSQILRLIGKISRIINTESNHDFKQFGLKNGQNSFLVRVCEHPGIHANELTAMMNVDKSTTSKAVQKLVQMGYLIKEIDQSNRRAVRLYPTERGEAVFPELIRNENRQLADGLKNFSQEEIRGLEELVKKMSDNYERS